VAVASNAASVADVSWLIWSLNVWSSHGRYREHGIVTVLKIGSAPRAADIANFRNQILQDFPLVESREKFGSRFRNQNAADGRAVASRFVPDVSVLAHEAAIRGVINVLRTASASLPSPCGLGQGRRCRGERQSAGRSVDPDARYSLVSVAPFG
jgi:hypothetical protein